MFSDSKCMKLDCNSLGRIVMRLCVLSVLFSASLPSWASENEVESVTDTLLAAEDRDEYFKSLLDDAKASAKNFYNDLDNVELQVEFNMDLSRLEEAIRVIEGLPASDQASLSEYLGDAHMLLPFEYANASQHYYIAIISGRGDRELAQKFSGAIKRMIANAPPVDTDIPAHKLDTFLVMPGQVRWTADDENAWKYFHEWIDGENDDFHAMFSVENDKMRRCLNTLAVRVRAQASSTGEGFGSRLNNSDGKMKRGDGIKPGGQPAPDIEKIVWEEVASLEKSPNSLREIELRLMVLSRHRAHLRLEFPNLPNFEAIEKKFPDTDEAQLLEMFYQVMLSRDNEDVLAKVDDLKLEKDDVRPMFLKFFVLSDNRDFAQARKMLENVLEVDPGNQRALEALKQLDHQP